MRIAQISKADSFGGGASRVAEELSNILRAEGYTAHHWASWSGKGYDHIGRFPLYGRFERQIRAAHYLTKKIGFPELLPFELGTLLRHQRQQNYDLLHFHDLSSAISPLTLGHLSKKMPVIWTFHDCSPFTGGCLYPMQCDRFRMGCGNCPQIGQWPIDSFIDATRALHRVKKHIHSSNRIICITPSRWMADLAFQSGLFLKKPLVINNAVNTNIYTPSDKRAVRQSLGIPNKRNVILISAGHILDERKGTLLALEALNSCKHLKPFLLVVGAIDKTAETLLSPFDYYATGYIADQQKMATIYSAADVFLFCSLADNQPLVILETMAAGTPLVGFATGGIPEMVEQDVTGFLVPQRDIKALSQGLSIAFSDSRHKRWSAEGRRKALDEFSWKNWGANHLDLYYEVVKSHHTKWLK